MFLKYPLLPNLSACYFRLFRIFDYYEFRRSVDPGIAEHPIDIGAGPESRDARLLRHHLGARFGSLHPEIARRFAHSDREEPLHFEGCMTHVRRSALGWLLAQVTRFSGLIPGYQGTDVPFSFTVRPHGLAWRKHRCYRFRDGPFDFRSVMRPEPDGRLAERFRGALGMYLVLEPGEGTLEFRDAGYFLHFGTWRLDLPRWLHPGRFRLVHRNLDARSFSVHLTLRHRWFGTLVDQAGTFHGEP